MFSPVLREEGAGHWTTQQNTFGVSAEEDRSVMKQGIMITTQKRNV